MNSRQHGCRHAFGIVSMLAILALAVHGYHPWAEDGGLYVAGIKRVLDPTLYGPRPDFVTAPMRFSLFAPIVAAAVRATHLPLPWLLLAIHFAGIWFTLYAGWMLASRCAESHAARLGAVALLACWLTMPIAGTSLMLMDPYVTARSLSTPLVLLAIAWAMDGTGDRPGSWLLPALALALAALVHPLMAGYGAAAVLLVVCANARSRMARVWGAPALAALVLIGTLLVQASAPAESANYVQVALTRYYWFPFLWHWYEQLGLLAPLALLFVLARHGSPRSQALARSAVQLGLIAILVAAVFARANLATHLVSRLQPLRCFQVVYEIMILLLGAWLGERWLRSHPWRWAAVLALCGGVMFYVQRQTYAHTNHLELPWRAPSNPWEQAFTWARGHTPKDAIFAIDARYITQGEHEDAQCFRAIAERNALPDYSKDGGEASIAPSLTEAWTHGQSAQNSLERQTDAQRTAHLQPLSASWIVLETRSKTAWNCPYANTTVKVCRLP